jgi:hypothetical protein
MLTGSFLEEGPILALPEEQAVVLSLSWAGIEPERGLFNPNLLQELDQSLTLARRRKIEPILCLHSGGLPDWQLAKGGWLDPDVGAAWGCFVDKVARELAEKISYWIVFRSILKESAWYRGEERKAALAMIHAHASAYLTLHRGPGFGGRATRVGCLEPVEDGNRIRERFMHWSSLACIDSLATGRLKLPFSPIGELSNGTPALDFIGVESSSISALIEASRWRLPLFSVGLPLKLATEAASAVLSAGARLEGVLNR